MNSWVMIYLNGGVGSDLLIAGPFASLQQAMVGIITTGQPFNLQPCQVWGPGPTVPNGIADPVIVSVGAWIAVCPGADEGGNIRLIGYGTFPSKADAEAWARQQDTPSAFSFGQVFATL